MFENNRRTVYENNAPVDRKSSEILYEILFLYNIYTYCVVCVISSEYKLIKMLLYLFIQRPEGK